MSVDQEVTIANDDVTDVGAAYRIRIIVAGSRYWGNYLVLERSLDTIFYSAKRDEIQLVSGMAKSGADFLVQRYNKEHMPNELACFPADWDTHGKSAGYIRNDAMAKYSTHLIAFWDGKSKGTKHMIYLARKHGLYVKIILIDIPKEVPHGQS